MRSHCVRKCRQAERERETAAEMDCAAVRCASQLHNRPLSSKHVLHPSSLQSLWSAYYLAMDAPDDEIESILYICREVSVYKIPPLKTNEGHRAQDWGDLAKPLWKGTSWIFSDRLAPE